MTILIEARCASFGYDDVPVVVDADLTIHDGEVVALLGPNGSGKSTLVRGLLGLVPLLGGQVQLWGQDLSVAGPHPRLGYVPQRHTLAAAVRSTVKEIVEMGRLPQRPWWRPMRQVDRGLVMRALTVVGLADRATHEVATLSGGQQRRVLIARALAGEPDVLVMDEPTAGVDAANQVVLTEVLRELAHDGTALLIVTHELDALEDIVTRIVCLDGGRIDFDGTPAAYAAHLVARTDHPHPGSDHHHPDDATPVSSPPILAPVPLTTSTNEHY